MTTPPEQRIRAYLEQRDRPAEVAFGRLLGSWGIHGEPTAAQLDELAGALERAGVEPQPDLRRASLQDTVTLRLAAPGVAAAAPAAARLILAVGALGTVASLFLPWFTGSRGGIDLTELSTGWEWLELLDVLMFLSASAAALLVARDPGRTAALAVAALAAVTFLGVAYRVGVPPDHVVEPFKLDLRREAGPYVAIATLSAIVFGAWSLASPAREGTFLRTGQVDAPPRA